MKLILQKLKVKLKKSKETIIIRLVKNLSLLINNQLRKAKIKLFKINVDYSILQKDYKNINTFNIILIVWLQVLLFFYF